LIAVAGTVSIVFWLRIDPSGDLQARVPGLDRPAGSDVQTVERAAATAVREPTGGPGVPSASIGQWPGFRGQNRDAVSLDTTPLARSWPAGGPALLWSVTLGEGYAGAAVSNGRVYVLDYDAVAAADTLRCLSLDDGREVWRNSYPVELTPNHGMSRTVPAVAGDYVITLGPRCHLACWDAQTGTCHWLIDLAEEHGAKVPLWYTGQCPLIDQDRLIVAPCGEALLVAFDYKSGDVVWESPNPRVWTMTHSSIIPMEFQGRRLYIYCGSGGVAGIAADDGTLLWDSTEWPEQFATAPSPVVLPGGRIFLCSGYGSTTGSLMLQLHADGRQITADVAFRLSPREFNAEQHTPIFHQQHLFGIRKRGRGQMVCLDLEGSEVWNSGRDHFGHGPFMFADGLLFAMDDEGLLTLAEVTPGGYRPLAQYQAFADGHDAWGPMAIVAGRLIVRDMTRMQCLDVAAKE
jgi:outer membrane protein assembly factor BamB